MDSSKKILLTTIGIAILICIVSGVTFAFFNYTRTGSGNTIKVGRISFVTRQTSTINLVNAFPINSEDVDTDTDNVDEVVIEIEGDTDYVDGIEYLVSSVDSSIYTSSGMVVPISLDIEVDGLGTENNNYFTARDSKNANIYKQIVGETLVGDQMLLVGYIKKNTTNGQAEGVDGSITIKAYFDKDKILISDTYDGTESDNMGTLNSMAEGKTVITTTEWNALQSSGLSFKVKVEANEGIWVNGSLEEIMRKSAVMDNVSSTYVSAQSGINFGAVSSDTNGKGVYMRAGTENDDYPIMYYRGAVEDNNVLFANKCWKAVRTTDTGGVKLIYNGVQSALKVPLAESDYTIATNTGSFTFDSSDNTWTRTITGTDGSSSAPLEISFNVPSGDDYLIQISGVTSTTGSVTLTIYKGSSSVNGTGNGGGGALSLSYSYETLTASDVIKMTYYGNGTSESPSIIKVKMIKPDAALGTGCDNSVSASQITLNVGGTDTNTFKFSTDSGAYNSPAYNGYMYGIVYEYKQKNSSSIFKFGTGFTYNNGTYTLTSAENGFATTRHYTCFTSSETCDGTDLGKIYYVYYRSGNDYYYIELENGKSVEDALREMQTNTNDSNAKDKIETWYASNMTSYTNKIEDTIYCNDRSMATQTNGWVANGGGILYYAPHGRAYTTYSPSLSCTNKNDAFTWKNGNGNQKLEYPVGMITSDEVMLAGGKGSNASTYYLTTGSYYWSLSPYDFNMSNAYEFYVGNNGSLYSYQDTVFTHGLRPVISLKPGTPVVSGTGTVLDPYVIG